MFNVDEYYNEERQCTYKGEVYIVRNNGAVLRCQKNTSKTRPLDNKWTFGVLGDKGYLYIAGVQIHRIVATAFCGESPTPQHIVDHIDTNRQNNRPENLHWVTKLENALNNPITRKRIVAICGSIEAFLENPSTLGESQLDPNFAWMRRVTPMEAKISKERLEEWAKSDIPSSRGKLGAWVYEKQITFAKDTFNNDKESDCTISLTTNAIQKNWRTPTEFLCCPKEISDTPLEDYLKNLQNGKVFSKNQYGQSEIERFSLSNDKKSIVIQSYDSENQVKNFFVAKITYENKIFVHTAIGSYFGEDGAEKYYTLALGEEWTGGDVFDDYC
ncbi:MAG: HNH endonuclease [Alphaproteobacteria bacterium]|nr:HNH endonuclease [Alphaproteobacteria bacterium]